jgi:hypothetical protein
LTVGVHSGRKGYGPVLDLIVIGGVLALIALVALVERGVQRL